MDGLFLNEEYFRVISDISPVAMILCRQDDGSIVYGNKQSLELFNLENFNGINIYDLLNQNSDHLALEAVSIISRGKSVKNYEISINSKGAETQRFSLNSRKFKVKGVDYVCCALLDVTENYELTRQLNYYATYDDLTGLVNRREFEVRLQEMIEISKDSKITNVLCYLDLDQFKLINDTCGHMAGDELLRQLADVIYSCIRKDDTLARLGGDEFAILLGNCPLSYAEELVENVRQLIEKYRFTWEGSVNTVGVSIGLTPIDTEGDTVTDAMRRADAACYAAKELGRNRIHVFDLDDHEMAVRHGETRWVSRINAAMDEGRLELWSQDIARPSLFPDSLKNSKHFELLLRMKDKDGRIIPPGLFLPSAERYDLAPKIDRWVLMELVNWYRRSPEQCKIMEKCAVNLSGQTLGDENYLSLLLDYINNAEISPEKICFEITETAAIQNLSNAVQFITTLKEKGCSFSLDDFGSGLSSFAYLKNLPVDYIKIDGVFVKDIVSDPVDLAMVKAINDMAHAMDKQTIAEFVEDEEILEMLIDLGVDYVQGYGIARPTPLIYDQP